MLLTVTTTTVLRRISVTCCTRTLRGFRRKSFLSAKLTSSIPRRRIVARLPSCWRLIRSPWCEAVAARLEREGNSSSTSTTAHMVRILSLASPLGGFSRPH